MGNLGLTGRREYSENKAISDLLGLIDNGVVVSKKLQHSLVMSWYVTGYLLFLNLFFE